MANTPLNSYNNHKGTLYLPNIEMFLVFLHRSLYLCSKTKANLMLENGLTHTSTRTVEEHHLASHVGSGDLRVLSTPSMIALMEEASMLCAAPHLSEGQTTVGGHISASHLKPTAHGRNITATATLTAVEGRKLQFNVTASDENGVIGEGEHTRFIVDREKFMERLG